MSQSADNDTVVEFDPETGFVSEIQADGQPAAAPRRSAAAAHDASLEQVREILVGAQTRDFEAKLQTVREDLDRSIRQLTRENAERIDKLEDHVKSEIKKVFTKLDSGIESTEKKMQELTERMGQTETDLQEAFTPQINAVAEQFETLKQRLEAETDQLRAQLVDRASLAEALTEIGMRMKDGAARSDTGADRSNW